MYNELACVCKCVCVEILKVFFFSSCCILALRDKDCGVGILHLCKGFLYAGLKFYACHQHVSFREDLP